MSSTQHSNYKVDSRIDGDIYLGIDNEQKTQSKSKWDSNLAIVVYGIVFAVGATAAVYGGLSLTGKMQLGHMVWGLGKMGTMGVIGGGGLVGVAALGVGIGAVYNRNQREMSDEEAVSKANVLKGREEDVKATLKSIKKNQVHQKQQEVEKFKKEINRIFTKRYGQQESHSIHGKGMQVLYKLQMNECVAYKKDKQNRDQYVVYDERGVRFINPDEMAALVYEENGHHKLIEKFGELEKRNYEKHNLLNSTI